MDEHADRLIKSALGAPAQVQQRPTPTQQVVFSIMDIVALQGADILTREQAFDMLFKGKPPTEYLCGPKRGVNG